MEQNQKRSLLNMTYYALVTFAILFGIIFMIYLGSQDVVLYAKIAYWIITDVMIGIVIFDIICTNLRKMKYISGVILFIGTAVTIIFDIIVYISLSTDLLLTPVQLFPYLALFGLSSFVTIFTIIMYYVGHKLVEGTRKRVVTTTVRKKVTR